MPYHIGWFLWLWHMTGWEWFLHMVHGVPAGQTITSDYYCWFLQHHLCLAMWYKHPRILQNNLPIMLHDVFCHVANNITPTATMTVWNLGTFSLLTWHGFLWLWSVSRIEGILPKPLISSCFICTLCNRTFHHWHQQSRPCQ